MLRSIFQHLFVLSLVVHCCALPAAAQEASGTGTDVLDLDQCIAIAIERAASAENARNELKLSGVEVLKSYGQFLPTVTTRATYTPVNVSRSYSAASEQTFRTDSETASLSVSAALNIFNGFGDYASLRQALEGREAGRMSLERALQTIAYDVTEAYYQVLLDRELLKIAEENLETSRNRLTLTRRQYEIGLKPVTEFYQQQADTAQAELEVIRAEQRLFGSRIGLQKRLRIDPGTEVLIASVTAEDILPASPAATEALVDVALSSRPDLAGAARSSKAAEWGVVLARSTRWPSLDLQFTASTDGVNFYRDYSGTAVYPPLREQLEDGIDYSLGLNMNWTLFDGFLTRYGVEQAKVTQLRTLLAERDLRDDVVLDVRLAAGSLKAAIKQLATAEEGLKSALKAYASVMKKFELGAAGFIEAQNASASLVAARSEKTQAAYNVALQKSALDYATGRSPYQPKPSSGHVETE